MLEEIKEIILLIEDDLGTAELVREKLGESGKNVVHVKSGNEARAWLEHNRPRLILLDYFLPDMTGAEFVKQTSNMPPFIVVTGVGNENTAVTMMKRGARDYLAKDSYFLENLPLVVDQVLRELAIERQLAESESQREATLEALRASEERLHVIFEHANDAIHIDNADDEILDVNSRMCEMLGYSREELLKMKIADLQAPEFRMTGNIILTEMEQYGNSLFEKVNIHRDGRRIPVEISVSRIESPQGQGDLYISILRDITERKQAEEALKESEQRSRALFENSPVAVWEEDFSQAKLRFDHLRSSGVVDLGTYLNENPQEVLHLASLIKIMDINTAGVSLLGAKEKKELIIDLPKYFTDESLNVFREEMASLWKGEISFKCEIPVINVAGENMFLNLSLSVMPGYETTLGRVLISFMDITERKRMENALRENEAKYRRLYEDAAIGIFHSTFEGRFIDVNPALARMLGYDSPQEAVNSIHSISEQVYVDPPQRSKILADTLAKGEAVVAENRYRRKDGTVWIGNLILRHVMDADGKAQYLEGFVEDITARKQAEEHREFERREKEALMNSTKDLIWSVNKDFKLIAGNNSFIESVKGFSGVALTPGGLILSKEIFSPELIIFWEDIYKTALSGESVRQDFFTPATKDLQDSWLELNINPIWDEKEVVGIACFGKDITERKQAEDALHLSTQDLKEAQAVARLGNWKWDIKKGEITWSDEMYRIFGIDKNSYTGRLGDVIAKVIHPDDLYLVLPSNAQSFAEKKPIEYRILLPDGSIRHIWAKSGETVIDGEGKPIFLTGIAQDITERKQAEEALRQANERLAFAQRSAGAGIWDWDMVTGKLNWSLEFFQLFGLDPAKMEANFDTWRGALHPDDVQVAEQRITESIRDHVPLFNEYRVVTPSGETRWIGAWGNTDYNERGEALRMSGMCIDITERKRIEEALQKSEERYRLLFNGMTEGFALHELIFDESGEPCDYRFLDVNPAFERLTGLKREDIIGKGQREVLLAEDPFWFETYCKVALTGESIHLENYSPPLQRYYEVYAYCPAPNQFAVVFKDITERKQAGEQLRLSEQQFRNYFELGVVGMAITSPEKGWVEYNDQLCHLFGYSREELKDLTWAQMTHPDDLPADAANFERVMAGEIDGYSMDKRFIHKDGNVIHVSLSVHCLRRPDGEVEHFAAVLQDITARKQAEEEIRQLNANLEQRVEERTRELSDAHEQLVRNEKLAVLGQMAGSVGHELRNPLGVISNAVYFLKMVQTDASDKVKEYLDIIERNIRISDKIVRDLLDFTRVKSAEREAVSIPQLIRQTLENFPAPESVQVMLNLPEDLPRAYADPQHVVQILSNLTLNACQAMTSPSGRRSTDALKSVPQGGKLAISSRVQDDDLRITIQDTGAGISPENMKKLFEPLFTTKSKGIGLGLAVCKKLAEANSGRIEVESEVGKGSTFTLYLPIYRSAS